jgi:hypothetical protein
MIIMVDAVPASFVPGPYRIHWGACRRSRYREP